MDTLTLKGLRFDANHGYYEQERREGNRFEVDLVFTADLKPAAREDELGKTINYEQAERLVAEVMEGASVHLIETLAYRIGESIFHTFGQLHALEVSVRKLSPPLETPTAHSEVTMQWQR